MRVPRPRAFGQVADVGRGGRPTQRPRQRRASLSYSAIKARFKVRFLLPGQLSNEGNTSAPAAVFLAGAWSPVSYGLRKDEALFKAPDHLGLSAAFITGTESVPCPSRPLPPPPGSLSERGTNAFCFHRENRFSRKGEDRQLRESQSTHRGGRERNKASEEEATRRAKSQMQEM